MIKIKDRLLIIFLIFILSIMMVTVIQKARISRLTFDILIISCMGMFALVIIFSVIKLINKK